MFKRNERVMPSSMRESLRRGIACQRTSLSVDSKDRKSILASVYNRVGVGKGAQWSLKNLLSPIYGSFFCSCFSGVSYKKVLFWQVGGSYSEEFGEVEQGSVPTV